MAVRYGVMKNDNYAQKGFTLLEVLLALSLAGLFFGIMGASLAQSAYTQKLLSGRITALVFGAGKLAELEAGGENLTAGVFSRANIAYKWQVSETTGENGDDLVLTVS